MPMQYFEAREFAHTRGIPLYRDFHSLDWDTIETIRRAGKERGYRKPRNANGSYARYFYAYLNRCATREMRNPR